MRVFLFVKGIRRALKELGFPKKDEVFFREEEGQRKKSNDFMNSKIVQNDVCSDELLNSRRDNEKNERTLVVRSFFIRFLCKKTLEKMFFECYNRGKSLKE